MSEKFTVGISPCPNDTFIFHALLHKLVDWPADVEYEAHMADVEELNQRARRKILPITKISLGVAPHILDDYAILSSGAALGWGCGPVLVAAGENFDPASATIAIPGKNTTAAMLLDLNGNYGGERVEMRFDEIMPAVKSGKAQLGLIIHEGRFTYSQHGLRKVLDLGEWWEKKWHLPLPLGAIAVRRDLPSEIMLIIQEQIAQSLDFAWKYPEKSKAFIKSHAQELEDKVVEEHIRTFVTAYSRDLGEKGKMAIKHLLKATGINNANIGEVFVDDMLL